MREVMIISPLCCCFLQSEKDFNGQKMSTGWQKWKDKCQGVNVDKHCPWKEIVICTKEQQSLIDFILYTLTFMVTGLL